MFTAHGFDAVKVADIAAEVGMAPSTLYRHFPTKESIVLWDEHDDDREAIVGTLRGVTEGFDRIVALADTGDAAIRGQVLALAAYAGVWATRP